MCKTVKIVILIAGIFAILLAAGIYSLVSFLQYNAVKEAAETAVALRMFF